MIGAVWKISEETHFKKTDDWLISKLAQNRGLTTKAKLEAFLNPNLEQIIATKLTDLNKAVERIKSAIKNEENVIVYSDYDADGICATAILWETLYDLGAKVLPYVPHRIKEGYGLSVEAIKNLAAKNTNLIITVDHGVTAVKQVAEANKLNVDVIVSDHHLLPEKVPESYALVHTTALCGAGVAWRLAWEVASKIKPSYKSVLEEKLELAAIATVADLVPLIGANRAIVAIGLKKIASTKRPGLKSLIKDSGITGTIGTYEIGHILAPRINAMGRIEHGMDSLRLLCARSQQKADTLAKLLSKTNSRRQDLTTSAVSAAVAMVNGDHLVGVLAHETWHEGVIGLVASRLVEAHNKPMIVISRGQVYSKGSARSIPGFNIVDAIRASSELLVDAGGHPMAAGFTIETKHIDAFTKKINVYAAQKLTDELLTPVINIECVLPSDLINGQTLQVTKTFEPYGMGNPKPVFLTRKMIIEDIRLVGQGSKHLKLQLDDKQAIWFNIAEDGLRLRPGNLLDVVYTIEENRYNGSNTLQMKIKDLEIAES